MRVEREGWVPILEVPPSERLMVSYGGPYSQQLLLNHGVVDRFLKIASLDGGKARVLINESHVLRARSILDGVNPDGSVTGRRGLTWEEKKEVEDKRVNPYFQVESDPTGWTISLNGRLIQEDLIERGLSMREAARPFTARFNGLLREGLQKVLLKDKCTLTQDPWLIGRLGPMVLYSCTLIRDSMQMDFPHISLDIMLYASFMALINHAGRNITEKIFLIDKSSRFPVRPGALMSKIFTFHRRTVTNMMETFAPPFEIDRLVGSLGYLQYQRVRGNGLVRMAPAH